MERPDTRSPSLSRRGLLGGVAGLAASTGLPGAAGAGGPDLSVMTRNLYVGVDLFRLFEARSIADVRRIAGQLLVELASHPFSARAEAIAAEVAASDPDVVAVQEAIDLQTRNLGASDDSSPDTADESPSDTTDDASPDTGAVSVDFLDLLTASLAARGLSYEVVAETITTDVAVPAAVDGGEVDVRLTDRVALLVRDGIETDRSRTGTFESALSISMEDADLSVRRGYCLVDVTVDSCELTVGTTHLESADGGRRLEQARELLDRLPADGPVVLAGDVNSGPGAETAAYDLLVESFEDAHSTLRTDADGFTCCHATDLQNDDDRLSRRIDVVLSRGCLRPVAVERVGADPADRLTTEVDGETVQLWPSDHAGVVASFEVSTSTAPTADARTRTPTATARTPTTTATTLSHRWGVQPTVSLVGYGSLVALVVLGAAALVRRRLGG